MNAEETTVRREEGFLEGEVAHMRVENHPDALERHRDGDFPFETGIVEHFNPPSDGTGMQFNHEAHPSDNVHFRRAWAYLIDTTPWERQPAMSPVSHVHSFFSDNEAATWVSDEVYDNFTDYGLQEHRWDDAEAELEAGGFERNSNGDWILQEDSPDGEAGAPMGLTINAMPWMPWLHDRASDFYADIGDWGISVEGTTDDMPNIESDDWTVSWCHTGGAMPEFAFSQVYLDEDSWWFRHDYNIPSTILAPPIGESTGPGASTDNWEEYEVITMAERLPVTTEETAYQQLVDNLAWAMNQSVNHMGVVIRTITTIYDAERWSLAQPADYPEKWPEIIDRIQEYGVVQYQG